MTDCVTDPVQDFLPCLKDHLLGRLRGLIYNGNKYDFNDEDRHCVIILNNKIYKHTYLQAHISTSTHIYKHVYLRLNYTMYDLWQDQDSINAHSHPNIMLLSEEDKRLHPYW